MKNLDMMSYLDEAEHDAQTLKAERPDGYKSPLGASVMSLLLVPGIGQFYIGKHVKGVAFLVGLFILGFTVTGNLWLISMVSIRVWSAVDAYHDTKRINEELADYYY